MTTDSLLCLFLYIFVLETWIIELIWVDMYILNFHFSIMIIGFKLWAFLGPCNGKHQVMMVREHIAEKINVEPCRSTSTLLLTYFVHILISPNTDSHPTNMKNNFFMPQIYHSLCSSYICAEWCMSLWLIPNTNIIMFFIYGHVKLLAGRQGSRDKT